MKISLKGLCCHPAQTIRAADINLSDTAHNQNRHSSRATISLAYSSSCCLKGQTGHRKARMSSLVLFPITDTLITLHWKEMEDKLSLSNKQVPFNIAKMSGKTPGSLQLNQHWLPCIYFAVFSQKLNHYNFPGNKSSAGTLFFLWRKTSFLVWINRPDNSTRPTGSVWTTRTVIPPGKHKRTPPPPQPEAITSDCGHKVRLQTFLKDGAPCWLRWTSWVYCYGNCPRTHFNTKATIGIKITDRGPDGGYISKCVQGKVF